MYLLLSGLQATGLTRSTLLIDHKRPSTVTELDHSFVLKLRIGFDHGCGTNDEFLCQRADARQLAARHQCADFDCVFDLFDQLNV